MNDYVEIFKALGDQTRLRILHLLLKADTELCVCELVDSLEVSQYNVSKHLKVLTNAGFVESRKEGRWVYFSIAKDKNPFKDFVLKAISSISEPLIEKDQSELKKRLNMRTQGKCLLGVQKKHLLKRIQLESK